MNIGQDALDEKYRFGYSFKNPRVVKSVGDVKPYPWFQVDWGTKGPIQTREELFRNGELNKYPAVWRRGAKRMHRSKLGDFERVELPDFQELGQAPGPTSVQSTVNRGFWGSLTNVLTKTTDVMAMREQAKIAQAQAEISARIPITTTIVETAQTYWPVLLIGGGAVLYMMIGRRK